MKLLLVTLFLSIAFINTVSASAYIGFGVGTVFYEADFSSLGGGSLDDNGTGTKLYGGFQFNDYISAEIAAYNFSEASVDAILLNNSTISAATKANGIAVYGVASYPVNKEIKLSAKLGMLDWDADLRVNNVNASNDGTDLAYGFSASYAFTRELEGVVEWENFETDNPELSLFTLGFKFSFK